MATVACKLPNGVTIDHAGKSVTFAGANSDTAVAGFGMTRDVDGAWFKDLADGDFKDFAPIKRGLLFLAKDDNEAADKAREREREVSGQEPLDPDAPGHGVEPTEEQKTATAKAKATPASRAK